MKVVTAKDMQEIDRQTIEQGFATGSELMLRAGQKCSKEILEFCSSLNPRHVQRFLIFCGKGNNGGDGFVIAHELMSLGHLTLVVCDHSDSDFSTTAQEMFELYTGPMMTSKQVIFQQGDIMIDCLFGTGINKELSSQVQELIKKINTSQKPVISIDIPSGLCGTHGKVYGTAIKAHLTLSIGLAKSGFFLEQGPLHTGQLRNLDIGFPKSIVAAFPAQFEATFIDDIKINELQAKDHKYSRGQVLIIGGSNIYSGAPILSAEAALRSGAGLVVLASPPSQRTMSHSIVHIPIDEWAKDQWLDDQVEKSKVICIGPGLKSNTQTKAILQKCLQSNKKLIIDASALDLLAECTEFLPRSACTVITPHDGEIIRLAHALKMNPSSPKSIAKELAIQFKIFVLLKGKNSLIYTLSGDYAINTSGSPALSCAGSGDCLSGILSAALLDKKRDDFENIKVACFIHGLTAELSHLPKGSFFADQILHELPRVIAYLLPTA